MNKIIEFWRSSYDSDRIAFYLELSSFIFTVGASLTLALTAAQPDMKLVYPFFLLGSITGLIGYIRRRLAWPMMLTGWFVIVNILGFGVAVGWI